MHFSALLAVLPLTLATPTHKAPLLRRDNADLIPGKYIVMFKNSPGVSPSAARVQQISGSIAAPPDHVFKNIGGGGLAVSLSDVELEKLRLMPHVSYIEQDSRVNISATQQDSTWGLGRISSKKPGSTTYNYDDSAGAGTCAYVIDTGIDVDHPDFEGRATFAKSFVEGATTDDQGHGTHCAGTVGSKTYGVAKKTHLYAVKTLDKNGSGDSSDIIAGMDYVIEDSKTRSCPNGVIVSMSFGGSRSSATNDAAKALVDAGFFVAVAAGNGLPLLGIPIDAASQSPASEPSVCTIGATQKDDKVASFSNFGSVVDLHAPGVDVVSLKPGGGTTSLSGTSMATPHVAGLGAYFMGLGKPAKGLCEYLQSIALKDVIRGVPVGTKNLLIQNDKSA
ncbi:hypothetical protein QQS21_008964 [Conoideocrella luteorostrata]|uniref:Uncharacterized protein n=1 Tax=Conoideocrella luteorostrata TaxID=1105319 RepID=A0AAJ0FQQ0_9HYPO|nr:hypothetical protein QQS21_008964 [Conoideocrella luteorostrata]